MENNKTHKRKNTNTKTQTKASAREKNNSVTLPEPDAGDKISSYIKSRIATDRGRKNIIATAFLLAMTVLFPLLIGSQKYGAITKFKNDTFYTFALIAGFLTLAAILFHLIEMTDQPRRRSEELSSFRKFSNSFTLADAAVLLYWAGMMISTLLSDSPLLYFIGRTSRNDGAVIQTLYVMTYFIISRGLKYSENKAALFTVGGTAASFVAIVHYFGWDIQKTGFGIPRWELALVADKSYRVNNGINFLGSVGNINLLSYILVVAICVTAGLYITGAYRKNKWAAGLLLVCLAVMSYAERCANTDAGVVALICAVIIALPVLCTSVGNVIRYLVSSAVVLGGWFVNILTVDIALQEKSVEQKHYAIGCAVLLLLAAAMLLYLFEKKITVKPKLIRIYSVGFMVLCIAVIVAAALRAAETETKGNLYEMGQILKGNLSDKFGTSRLYTWKRIFTDLDLTSLFGHGPDSFVDVFKQAAGDASQYFQNRTVDKAHNEILQILVCQGLVGVISFVSFLFGLWRDAIRSERTSVTAPLFAVAVTAYAAHSMFGYALPINSPVMWTMFGLCGAAIASAKREDNDMSVILGAKRTYGKAASAVKTAHGKITSTGNKK
ncbi:MAG: O-antigen ligase family protein [Oscillospiraceae bacterium]|nr:O-antigen ligase family protein [Oscillospiraceae bacterium]